VGWCCPSRHSCLFTPANLEWVLVLFTASQLSVGMRAFVALMDMPRSVVELGCGLWVINPQQSSCFFNGVATFRFGGAIHDLDASVFIVFIVFIGMKCRFILRANLFFKRRSGLRGLGAGFESPHGFFFLHRLSFIIGFHRIGLNRYADPFFKPFGMRPKAPSYCFGRSLCWHGANALRAVITGSSSSSNPSFGRFFIVYHFFFKGRALQAVFMLRCRNRYVTASMLGMLSRVLH